MGIADTLSQHFTSKKTSAGVIKLKYRCTGKQNDKNSCAGQTIYPAEKIEKTVLHQIFEMLGKFKYEDINAYNSRIYTIAEKLCEQKNVYLKKQEKLSIEYDVLVHEIFNAYLIKAYI